MINIYIEKNLSLAYETYQSYTPLYLLCNTGTLQMIKYLTNIYIERNYNLDHTAKNGSNCLHVVCNHRSTKIVKFMIDTFAERKLSFKKFNGLTIEHMMNTNKNLKKNIMQMYLSSVETVVFTHA